MDVIVLGAGPAGLAAGRAAADAGAEVLVLEARSEPGGRVRTRRVPGLGPIELGAEFVHGDAPITRELMRRAGAKSLSRGRPPDDGRFDPLGDVLGKIAPRPDRSVAEAIAAVDADEEAKAMTLGFLTGFDALDPERASIRAILEEEGDDPGAGAMDSFRVDSGQAALLGPLAEGLVLRTRTRVRELRHGTDGVEVLADAWDGPHRFTARRAVVALPLGVLQAGDVRCDPPLDWPFDAVASGAAVRVVLVFDRRIWPEGKGFFSGDGSFPVFWADDHRPVITAWCGGPNARAMSSLPEDERVRRAASDLARAADLDLEGHLVAWYTHDWVHDALALGAYSYVTVGGVDKLPLLAEPRGSLVLAGEYVPSDAVSSTVEAALASGQRAGRWAAGP